MRAGELDKRVEILERQKVKDPNTGEEVEDFNPIKTRWMARRAAGEREVQSGSQTKAIISDVFTARFDAVKRLSPERHRLKFNGIEYNIHGFRELGRREWIEIRCEARGEMVQDSR